MLDYPSDSNIVTTDLEYPSVVYPWLGQKLNAKVRYVKNVNGKIPLDDVEKAIDDNTVALAISHVEYANGFRHNLRSLAEIAHKHGAYFIVDAINPQVLYLSMSNETTLTSSRLAATSG